ncbi:MAG: patatin family protein [Synergistaceae bacterium]|nr:patatin family protein [Synergistaceae bacterium]
MLGVIDVGGGLRGIYGTGILDYCLDQGIKFDYCIGVSAGSANLLSYLAGQREYNYHYFCEYSFRKEYMSLKNFLHKGSYLDMDYIFSKLCNSDGEMPLNYPAIIKSGIPLRIVTTSAKTGKTVYFTEKDLQQDCYNVIKASCSFPVINRPYIINNEPYYDGGISDPIPVEKAINDGCDRLVIILTKPNILYHDRLKWKIFSCFIQREFPKAAKLLRHHNSLYMAKIRTAMKYADEGRALIIAPKTIYNMTMLTKNKSILQNLYNDGIRDAQAINNFIKRGT